MRKVGFWEDTLIELLDRTGRMMLKYSNAIRVAETDEDAMRMLGEASERMDEILLEMAGLFQLDCVDKKQLPS